MTLAPHTLKSTARTKPAKRVGRGNSSQKGTTAGRGTKGQKSRAGGRGGLKLKGFRKSLLKIPKVRGFKSHRPRVQIITVKQLEHHAKVGHLVTPKWLASIGLVQNPLLSVKIVGNTPVTKVITMKGCLASKGAALIIEKAGGTITY